MLVFLIAALLAVLPFLLSVIMRAVRPTPHVRTVDGRRRHRVWGVSIALLWLWGNGSGLLWPVYAEVLHMNHWPHADMDPFPVAIAPTTNIILLGGGTERSGPGHILRPLGDSIEKIAVTAMLYHRLLAQHPALHVIISGGDPQHHGMAEADNYFPDLVSLGVDAKAIIRENRSFNTEQNARFVADETGAGRGSIGAPPQLLVTTAMHMQRALLYFQHVGIHVYPITPPPQHPRDGLLPTVRNISLSNGALHEIIGIAQFFVYTELHIY